MTGLLEHYEGLHARHKTSQEAQEHASRAWEAHNARKAKEKVLSKPELWEAHVEFMRAISGD